MTSKRKTGPNNREKHASSIGGEAREGLLEGTFVLLKNSMCKGPVAEVCSTEFLLLSSHTAL